jgi:undecaprenyl pyrophosphate synthase
MFDGAQLHTGFVRQPSIAGIYNKKKKNKNNAIIIMICCAMGSRRNLLLLVYGYAHMLLFLDMRL